MYTFNMA